MPLASEPPLRLPASHSLFDISLSKGVEELRAPFGADLRPVASTVLSAAGVVASFCRQCVVASHRILRLSCGTPQEPAREIACGEGRLTDA
jgi:hypothetical protein